MPSQFTPNKNLEQPAGGSYNNTWNVPINLDLAAIDNSFGGTTTIDVTSVPFGNHGLSSAQYQPPNIYFVGVLSANLGWFLSAGVGGVWSIFNQTTGPFGIAWATGVPGGRTVVLPQGQRSLVISDGVNVDFAQTAGSAPGNPSAVVGLAAVNGAASTFMRSDAAPPINQAIVPTWTGIHNFNGGVRLQSATTLSATQTLTAAGIINAAAGSVFVPTQSPGDNSTNAASDAFVTAALAASLISPHFTGTPLAPTAAVGTFTTQLATTAFARGTGNLSPNGYWIFPSGLMIAWGSGTFAGGGTTINLAAVVGSAFPNLCFTAVAGAFGAYQNTVVLSVSPTQIVIANGNGTSSSWCAFGN